MYSFDFSLVTSRSAVLTAHDRCGATATSHTICHDVCAPSQPCVPTAVPLQLPTPSSCGECRPMPARKASTGTEVGRGKAQGAAQTTNPRAPLRRRPVRQPPTLILLSPGSRWCGGPLVSLSPASNLLSSPTQALPQHPSLGLHSQPLPRRCWLWCHMVPCLNRPHRWLWCQMVPCHNRPHRHQQRLDPSRTLHLSPWPHRLQLDCRSEA